MDPHRNIYLNRLSSGLGIGCDVLCQEIKLLGIDNGFSSILDQALDNIVRTFKQGKELTTG